MSHELSELEYSEACIAKPLSRIESLPAELLHLILTSPALSKADVVAFGLSSPYIWPCILSTARADTRMAAATLAGTEIACTGTLLNSVPEPFVRAGFFVEDNHSARASALLGSQWTLRRLHAKKLRYYEELRVQPSDEWAEAWQRWERSACEGPRSKRAQQLGEELAFAAVGPGKTPDEAERTWALRNWDHKKFVQCHPGNGKLGDPVVQQDHTAKQLQQDIKKSEPYEHHVQQYGLVDDSDGDLIRIDDVLLLRTCWGRRLVKSKDEDKDDSTRALQRGEWVGCRFDIVPLAQGAVDEGGWVDSTAEVVDQARQIADAIGKSLRGS